MTKQETDGWTERWPGDAEAGQGGESVEPASQPVQRLLTRKTIGTRGEAEERRGGGGSKEEEEEEVVVVAVVVMPRWQSTLS